jgi:hypothetical protein
MIRLDTHNISQDITEVRKEYDGGHTAPDNDADTNL